MAENCIEHNLGACCYNAGIELIATNDITGAAKYFDKSLRYNDRNPDCLNALGLCKYIAGDFNRSIYYWEKSTAINPKSNKALEYLDYLKTKELEEFIAVYNKVLDLIERKRYIRAFRYIGKLQGSGITSAMNMAGLLYYKLGFKKKAIYIWQRVLECDSGNRDALRYLRYAK